MILKNASLGGIPAQKKSGMAQIVDLGYNLIGICNTDDIDLRSSRSSSTDGYISDANNALPYALDKIHCPHIFDPNLVLDFWNPATPDNNAVRRKLITGAFDLNQDENENDKSDNYWKQNYS